MPTAHPHFQRYFAILSSPTKPPRVTWCGDVFRISEPQWMSGPYRLTGVGAILSGGRWNVLKLMPAIYFATTPATATAEADAEATRLGWPPGSLVPKTRVTFNLNLQGVLDLTDANTLKALKVRKKDLITCDWAAEQAAGREALTQAVARAAFENSIEGLLVPSVRTPGGKNVVVFPPHMPPASTINPHDPGKIPFVHGL